MKCALFSGKSKVFDGYDELYSSQGLKIAFVGDVVSSFELKSNKFYVVSVPVFDPNIDVNKPQHVMDIPILFKEDEITLDKEV
jgi:hypothetical protein